MTLERVIEVRSVAGNEEGSIKGKILASTRGKRTRTRNDAYLTAGGG